VAHPAQLTERPPDVRRIPSSGRARPADGGQHVTARRERRRRTRAGGGHCPGAPEGNEEGPDMSTRWITAWAFVGCTALAGCRALTNGSAEAAGAKYRMGSLSATIDAPTRKTFEAATEVIEDLELRVDKAESSDVDAEIIAHSARDKKITLRVEALDEDSSEISIRVGSLGDEDISIRIYRRILEEL
jgi:hypothetical protein